MSALRTIVDSARGYGLLAKYEARSLLRPRRRPGAMRKSFLLLAPFLPPYDNGGVARPLSWLQYAGSHGWEAFAITRPFVGQPTALGRYLQERMPEKVNVSLMHEVELRPSWSLFPRTDGTFLGALGAIASGNAIIPGHAISVVVATGPSFDVFVSAYYLARMHGLPLVLDYRDEWTQNPHSMVRPGNSDVYWEARCLKAADLVLFTTERMRRHHHEVFPEVLDGKSAVLHNGWESVDSGEGLAVDRAGDPAHLRMTFAGSMGHATLPGGFLDDLAQSLRGSPELREIVRVEFVGFRVPEAEAQMAAFPYAANLSAKGIYAKNVANGMIRASDVLLLLVPTGMERYIPAKLFDYLAAGKPILVHGTEGEASDIVTMLGAGLFVRQGDSRALARALGDFRQAPAQRWQSESRLAWVRHHTREHLAGEFFGKLGALLP